MDYRVDYDLTQRFERDRPSIYPSHGSEYCCAGCMFLDEGHGVIDNTRERNANLLHVEDAAPRRSFEAGRLHIGVGKPIESVVADQQYSPYGRRDSTSMAARQLECLKVAPGDLADI